METILSFENLPSAVNILHQKLDVIEKLLAVQIDQKGPNQSEQFLDVKEAAKFLGLSVPTIYTKKCRGELTAYKPPKGKKLFFFKHELIEYIKKGKVQSSAELEARPEIYLKKRGGNNG